MFYKEISFKNEPLIGEIPQDWGCIELGKVVEIHDSQRIPLSEMERKNRKGPYPYCGANGIIDYIDDYIFDGEFVLLAEDGGSYGKFESTAYIMNGKFWVNNHAHVLQAIEGKTTNLFLKYVLDFLDLNPYVVGSTRKKLNQEQMREIKIPYPPLEEQRAVAGVLGVVDSVIAKTDEVIAKTERLKKGLMQTLLTRGIGHKEFKETEIGKIPKTWEVVKLEEVIDVVSGQYFKFSEFVNNGVRCLKIDNVGYGEIVWKTATFLPTDYLQKFPELVLKEGDIVMALNRPIIDNKVKVGMLQNGDSPSILYQRVGKIVIKDASKLNGRFLFFMLTGEHFKQQLGRSLIGTDQPYVRTPVLLQIKIPLPPISEQQRIAEILSYADRKLGLERLEKDRLERTKRGLMDLLLTGKVRVKVD